MRRFDAGSSSVKRDGRWVVPCAMRIRVDSGRVELDFSCAVITHPTLEITAEVNSGNLLLIVRAEVEVDAYDVAVGSGDVDLRRASEIATMVGSPALLRIELSGSVRSGGITARPPRPPRRGVGTWLLRRSQPTGR